jgi:hypothetical protein
MILRIAIKMKEMKFMRKGKTIRNIEDGHDTVFNSISMAKRASRTLQIAEDGGMGRGSLRVVEKLPEMELA